MIDKAIVYSVICDNCKCNNGEIDESYYGSEQEALQFAIDNGFIEVDGVHYCQDCYIQEGNLFKIKEKTK